MSFEFTFNNFTGTETVFLNLSSTYLETEKYLYYASEEISKVGDIQSTTQPMYTLFCDIISIDYDKLIDDLFNISKNFTLYSSDENSSYVLGNLIFKRLFQENEFLFYNKTFNSVFEKTNHFYLKGLDDSFKMDENFNYFSSTFWDIFCFKDYIEALINGNEKLYDIFILLKYLQHFMDGINLPLEVYEDINQEYQFDFNAFLNHLAHENNEQHYFCGDISEMLLISLIDILENHYSIKMCQHCGKYFVATNRSDTKYCERVSKEDPNKTCREYATYINYINKNKNDAATSLYRNIYNSLGNKYRRTNNSNIKAQINKLQSENTQWRNEVKHGIRTEENYIEWLKSEKERLLNK